MEGRSSLVETSSEDSRADGSSQLKDARFVLFRGGCILLAQTASIRPRLLSAQELVDLGVDTRQAVMIGADEGGSQWVLDLEDVDSKSITELEAYGAFRDLHLIREPIGADVWELLSRARILLTWNRETVLCPTCGAPTEARDGGTYRTCSDSTCRRILYPRTEPAVIVRVISGDMCLLARKGEFPHGVRSVIAGFVEAGETLERAVRREVKEEVGIELERIVYLGSQPWPFPAGLMIAFEANARGETIRIDPGELEAANWYTREQILREVYMGTLVLPSRKSIARGMIDEWLDGDCA